MNFVKGLFDSDKESLHSGSPGSRSRRSSSRTMNKNYEKAEKYNREKAKSGDQKKLNGSASSSKSATNKVTPLQNDPSTSNSTPKTATISMPLKDEPTETPPPRPKSRAVVLPSGLIIGSDEESDIHTSTLSSHSSDSFNPRNKLSKLVGMKVEDADTGNCLIPVDRKKSTIKRHTRTLDTRRKSAANLNNTSAPSQTKLSLSERRTLRRAERVGLTERKQLPFCTRVGYEFTVAVQRSGRKIQEIFRNAQIWGPSIKEIEGNLGSGVSTYFRVLRWLLKINVICMLLALGLIATPGIWMKRHHDLPDTSLNREDTVCTNPDFVNGTTTAANVANSILQFLTGQGWMEDTALFLGWYPASNITRNVGGVEKTTYNFPLAYLLVGFSYYLLALIFILNNIARLFKKTAVEKIETKVYTELVLGGWDYTIQNTKTAQLRSTTIIKSLKESLLNDAQKYHSRSLRQKIGIFLLRLLTNTLAIAAMVGTVFLYSQEIIQDTDESSANATNSCGQKITNFTVPDLDDLASLGNLTTEMLQMELEKAWSAYSAPIILSLSNIVFPIFFELLGQYEFYRFQSTRILVTMIRSFVMKLFSVCAFMYVLYTATKPSGGLSEALQTTNNTLFYNCWENYIGAQFYQLCIIDFIVFSIALFLSEVLRNILIRNVKWIRARLDQPEFNISKEILNLCYQQMIFWAALFFSPLMSCVAVIEVILIFYMRKHSALSNVRPPQKVVLTSQSSSMVNAVFLVSLVFIFVIVGAIVFQFKPSVNCGPFRGMKDVTEPLQLFIENSGAFKTYIYDIAKLTGVTIGIFIIVILVIYYFKSLASSRNLTIKLLRHQIKIEHVDKQFLIDYLKSSITGKPTQSDDKPGILSEVSLEGPSQGKQKTRTIHRYANPTMPR